MYSWNLTQSHTLKRTPPISNQCHKLQKDQGEGVRSGPGRWEHRGQYTGDGQKYSSRNQNRCIITAKDKEKPMALAKLFCQYLPRHTKRCATKSADLKGKRLHFQVILTANGRPLPLRFSSGVSVVQKLNVGFANTVYFTEIQHYKQQAPPTPPLPTPPPPVPLGADHAMRSEQWCLALLLWREI